MGQVLHGSATTTEAVRRERKGAGPPLRDQPYYSAEVEEARDGRGPTNGPRRTPLDGVDA